MERKIRKILVANRGVPAVRIMQTCRDLKIPTVAVYSTPDRLSLHVFMADEAVHIGEGPPLKSYLNMDRVIEAALSTGADAVHPGWGFLAENAEFARRVIEAGLIWIGPNPEIIALMGDKKAAKEVAKRANVPTIPGIEDPKSPEEILSWMERERIDFPIMLKAALGGGGKGMVKVESAEELPQKFSHAQSEAYKAFGDSSLIAEKYIERGRHIEVQIVGDKHGHIVHLFERECTIQRRNQKIIEETPAPSLDDDLRQEICFTAVRLMREIGYDSAGTVEFLLDAATRKFYFLEVNTRLQVEHGVTELATGLDIVDLMIQIAEGRPLPFHQRDIQSNRWAIECRLTAEDPRTFAPSFGTITRLQIPDGPNIRISSGVYEGAEIPPYYDSMFMLIMSAGADRDQAIRVMDRALSRGLRVEGVKTIAPLLISIIRHPKFRAGEFSTRFIEHHLEELVSAFKETDPDEEVLKIARYVAEISALGPQSWM
ncbi:acetyl/propionyl/methylcrotonyl-CoA carboxylase subunit alpha [Thermosulfurimonas sp. F29]|uniref:acetyl-CoA carboxylase biotin carboxylase subunit n=1 Tax=Thermosulfurimonas sp. F29 TaxID=2867247 RepID=UPI001C836EAF|nr:biotin carboxylase N-terminal domain-containing protein [Thermosulfurimonas sp. F29]MBX6422242.1 ATP-grasp domain-containing protein [Thermosulfurimonas sp. F29]